MYDKKLCRQVLIKHKLESKTEVQHTAELLRQSAVKSEHLTNDELWDAYISRIQAQIEKLEAMRDQAREELESAGIWDSTELSRIKSVVLEAKAMIKAFNIAISYPKEIINAQLESTSPKE